MTALLIGAIIYVILDFALLYRIFRGPTAAALDLTTATALVMYALYTGRAIYLDVGLVVALLGFVGTVFVSRYLEGRI